MISQVAHLFSQIQNCPDGKGQNCFTNVPQVSADQGSLTVVLSLVFGVLAAVAVIIIVIQGIKFSTSQGDPQKATDARKSIIYAIVGLIVALSAEVVVRLIISRI